MRPSSIQTCVLAAIATLGLTFTVVHSAAADTEAWPVVEESLTEFSQEIDGLKGKLSDLRNEKTHLFNETYALTNEDRTVAREPKLQSKKQEAQLEEVNIAIRATESKIDRHLKKRDYLVTVKRELRDPDSLDKTLGDIDTTVSTLERDLKPIRGRMEELAKTCHQCKVVLVSLEREPASESSEIREFRTLMRKRNQLEGSLDAYGLQVEALRDVKAYYRGQDAIQHPHRLNGGRPIELMK